MSAQKELKLYQRLSLLFLLKALSLLIIYNFSYKKYIYQSLLIFNLLRKFIYLFFTMYTYLFLAFQN